MKRRMSNELKAMLARPRNDKIKPTRDRNQCDTDTQKLLLLCANRLLAKGQKRYRREFSDGVVNAESIGENSRLRPTWHGRAS